MFLAAGEDLLSAPAPVPAGYGVLKTGVISQPSLTLPDYITAIPQVPAYDPGMSKADPYVVAQQQAVIKKKIAAAAAPVVQDISIPYVPVPTNKAMDLVAQYKYPLLGIGILGLIWLGMRK